MKVVCSNKHEYWCPYGTKSCECGMYEERDFIDGESFEFTCTAIDDDSRNCQLIFIPENDTELHIKKFFDMLTCGISVADAVKQIDWSGITMNDFLNVIIKNEFYCVKFQRLFTDEMDL